MNYDKDKARQKFFKEHPDFHEKYTTKNTVFYTTDVLDKIVKMYPYLPTYKIERELGLPAGSGNYAIQKLRKAGVNIPKIDKKKKVIDIVIKDLRKKRPALFK